MLDKFSGLCLGEDLLIITLGLAARRRSREKNPGSIEGELEKWLFLFSTGEELDPEFPSPPLIGGEFEEAKEIVETFTKSEAARHDYEKRLDYQRDRMAHEREERKWRQVEGSLKEEPQRLG